MCPQCGRGLGDVAPNNGLGNSSPDESALNFQLASMAKASRDADQFNARVHGKSAYERRDIPKGILEAAKQFIPVTEEPDDT